MTLPNFLVVGGARSGSSAICTFLGRHPEVFVTPVKEPSFYVFKDNPPKFTGPGDEYLMRMVCTTQSDYEALFASAGAAKAIGEGSVYYLHYPETFETINVELPDVKTIAILRDPVERAFSAYSLMIREGRETEPSFAAALSKEAERTAAGWEPIWEYTGGSFLADRVQKLLDVFGPDRVMLVRFDEFENNPKPLMSKVFSYLGVDPNFDASPEDRINASGKPKSRKLQDFLMNPHPAKDFVHKLVPEKLWQKLYWAINNRNLDPLKLDPQTRAKLLPLFAEDTARLEKITGWDLSSWKR